MSIAASSILPTVLTMLDKNKEDNGSKLIGEKNPVKHGDW